MGMELTVEGMSCGGCEQTVEDAIRDLEGVRGVSANESADTVTVEGEPDVDDVVDAVESAGYTVRA